MKFKMEAFLKGVSIIVAAGGLVSAIFTKDDDERIAKIVDEKLAKALSEKK